MVASLGGDEPCTRGRAQSLCVILVFALVLLAAAGGYPWWRWCCRDTTTRECPRSLPKHEGVSENAVVTESEC